jgi:hypothetical protein
MSRGLAGILVVAVLVVGLAVGVVAGTTLTSDATAGPVALATVVPSTPASQAPARTATPAPTPSPTPTASPTPTVPPSPTPEPTPALVPAPLTGRLVKPELATRHVVAVMIDDQFAARPQSGLSSASVVWQAPAEGGIPRYMALFQESSPKSVGPVRSSRIYFVQWAAEWNSVYVHVGGSPGALAFLRSSQGKGKSVYDADGFRYEGRYLWRINTRFAPHNVYSDGKNLRTMAKKVGAKAKEYKAAWQFAPDAPYVHRPKGGTIVVPYLANRITYKYNRKTNTYLRSVTGEQKQTDQANKARVAPKNVVIMVVSFQPLNDGSKKHRLEAGNIGKGTAWISTNGRTIKGTWAKKSVRGPTRFYDKQGNPVTLTVGQTFIQVIPKGTKPTIKDGSVPPVVITGAAGSNGGLVE